jgi:hypothetical protein
MSSGSLASLLACSPDVCLVCLCPMQTELQASSCRRFGFRLLRRNSPSFDHLIGAAEQRHRHFETKRLCGLEIDDQFELGGTLGR